MNVDLPEGVEQNRTEGLFPYKHIIYKYM